MKKRADDFNRNHTFNCGKLGSNQRRGMFYFLVEYYAENGVGFEVTADNRDEFIRERLVVINCFLIIFTIGCRVK